MNQTQKSNIVILLGLLAALPAEQYRHDRFGFGILGSDEDGGCACGLAIRNAEKFAVECTTSAVPDAERSLMDRLLGRNKVRTTVIAASKPADYYLWEWAAETFGEDAEKQVFSAYAFDDIGPFTVTKADVVDRLTAMAA